jgi:tRNA-dihydrouridine synthase B
MKICSILLTIGPYTLKSRVLLAPMAGVSDTPFRRVCQRFGAGLTTSEMLTAKTELWGSQKSRLRIVSTGNSDIPNSVQIVGSNPQEMANAAKECANNGADIIDINMGCPAKKVCHKAAGSALLKDEQLVANILNAVTSAVTIPVTLKIRTGWDVAHKNAMTIAKIAEDAGIKALTIHGRTRACRFNGEAEYDTIAEVKAHSNLPIIANGDINSAEQALAVLAHTHADGIMIGRGAQGSPWIFHDIIQALGGQPSISLSTPEKIQCMIEHIEALHLFYGERRSIGFARKHVGWYLQNLHLAHHRQPFNQLETTTAQLSFLHQLPNSPLEGIAA